MKFLVHTYGCQMNVRDSEAVEALMVAAGHEKAASEEDAEIVIVTSCTVRQKAEEKAVGKAGNLIAAKKIVGLAGCAVKHYLAEQKRSSRRVFDDVLAYARLPHSRAARPGVTSWEALTICARRCAMGRWRAASSRSASARGRRSDLRCGPRGQG